MTQSPIPLGLKEYHVHYVLVVDDSVVIRKLVTEALRGDPDIEVVGTAANGRMALNKLTQLNPDLITLDIEMPEMNGLETLAALRKTHPKLPVIMFSTLTQRGASVTLDALALGATDYVTKPANVGSVQLLQQVRRSHSKKGRRS
jgi:two-component system chemotaxis response regulator CheB